MEEEKSTVACLAKQKYFKQRTKQGKIDDLFVSQALALGTAAAGTGTEGTKRQKRDEAAEAAVAAATEEQVL